MRHIRHSAMGLIAAFMLTLAGTASAELSVIANHDHITIDFMYHGSTVSVKGMTEPGTDMIIKIASPDVHQFLKQKGKVGGLLWMNTGALSFEHVPNVYYVHSTGNIKDILSEDEIKANGLGYEALEANAEVSPIKNEADKARWFGEFVKFKESAKLYAASAGKIKLSPSAGGKTGYYILTDWHYQAPPGDYKVTVYSVKDKKVLEKAEADVKVEQIGGVKALANMARNNGALYGAISIISALGAGFGVGLIFKKDGGAH